MGQRPDATALFVRIPREEALKLDRAASELRLSKRELITGLVSRYVDPSSPAGLRALGEAAGARRTVIIEAGTDGLPVGHHSFRPTDPGEVLSAEEVADLLRVDESAVLELAERGEIPARRIGDEWRFSRSAVLTWLGTPEEEGSEETS